MSRLFDKKEKVIDLDEGNIPTIEAPPLPKTNGKLRETNNPNHYLDEKGQLWVWSDAPITQFTQVSENKNE